MNLGMRRAVPALILGLVAAVPAAAGVLTRPIWTFASYVGVGFFDGSYGMGAAMPFGARAGFSILGRFGLEANYGKTFGEAEGVPDREYPVDQYGVDATCDLLPRSWIDPYLFAGWGQLSLDAPGAKVLHMNGYEVGGGLKMLLFRDPVARWDLRLDARGLRVRNGSPLEGAGEMREHLLITAGIMMTMAGREESPDRDGDGVPDRADQCPDGPRGAIADANGCPTDADGDKVPDGIDLCDGTPPGLLVDATGCAGDSDGDGVFDGRDLCPETPARVLTDADGCPIAPRLDAVEVELLDSGFVLLDGGTFAPGSAMIRPGSQVFLDEIGRVLASRPALQVEIVAYADSLEAGAKAIDLSDRRAKVVRDNLIARHPELKSDRFQVAGQVALGSPVPETSRPGAAVARRVEIRVKKPGAVRSKR